MNGFKKISIGSFEFKDPMYDRLNGNGWAIIQDMYKQLILLRNQKDLDNFNQRINGNYYNKNYLSKFYVTFDLEVLFYSKVGFNVLSLFWDKPADEISGIMFGETPPENGIFVLNFVEKPWRWSHKHKDKEIVLLKSNFKPPKVFKNADIVLE